MKPVQLFPNLQRRLAMAHLLWPDKLYKNYAVLRALSSPSTRDRLLAFCQKESNAENVWFVLAVAQYRASPSWAEGNAIYECFLENDSPYLVNLNDKLFKALRGSRSELTLGVPRPDFFDLALSHIVPNLERDMYRRFLQDKEVGFGGNILMQNITDVKRTKQARADLWSTDWTLRQAAQSNVTSTAISARSHLDNRATLKQKLRAGSFDLALMGLA
jgi:hypothetical protein